MSSLVRKVLELKDEELKAFFMRASTGAERSVAGCRQQDWARQKSGVARPLSSALSRVDKYSGWVVVLEPTHGPIYRLDAFSTPGLL